MEISVLLVKITERFRLKLFLNFVPNATLWNSLTLYHKKKNKKKVSETFREAAIITKAAGILKIFVEVIVTIAPSQLQFLYRISLIYTI